MKSSLSLSEDDVARLEEHARRRRGEASVGQCQTVDVADGRGLRRFVEAQDEGGAFGDAVRELRNGRKQTHWMWFVFPQIAGLGHSERARHFAVSGLPEARAYLAHPLLGPRLRECAGVLTGLPTSDPVSIFGRTDAIKLRSSMTLFASAAPGERIFAQVLDQFFEGETDSATMRLLGDAGSAEDC